jgi:DamX protein
MSETTFRDDVTVDSFSKKYDNPYWYRYQLKQAPFADSAPYAMYYPIPQWQSHLQFLQKFCTSTYPITLIEGELGIGKTTLLAQFLADLDETIVVYQLQGRSTLNAEQLLFHLAQIFPIPLTEVTLPEQLQAFLRILEQQQKVFLLIIDDADLLPTETLAALTRLATLQNRERLYLYTALTSELRLDQQLENLAQEQGEQLKIPCVTLQPLNLENTRNYIKHRLLKAGLTGTFPFSMKMIGSIYELSGGVPGRINRVAQQMMIDALKPPQQEAIKATPPIQAKSENKSTAALWRRYPLISIVAIAIGIGFIFWRFPSSSNIKLNTSDLATTPQISPKNAIPLTIPPETTTKPAQVIKSKVAEPIAKAPTVKAATAPTVKVAKTPTVTAATTPAVAKTVAITPIIKKENKTETKLATATEPAANIANVPPILAPAKPLPPVVKQSKPAVATHSIPTPTRTKPPIAKPAIKNAILDKPNYAPGNKSKPQMSKQASFAAALALDEKNLMTMQGGYTIQVIGSRSPDDIQLFMAKYHYLPGNFLRFETTYESKPWYVLVFGRYADETQAKTALQKLPKELQSMQAWVRPVTSVQEAIKQ